MNIPNKPTIKHSIVKELEITGDWVFGGKLARVIADKHQAKESNVERRMRELCNEGFIEHRYVENPSKGNKVVQYRINSKAMPLKYQLDVILKREINKETLF